MNLVEVQPLNVNNLWSVKRCLLRCQFVFLEEKRERKQNICKFYRLNKFTKSSVQLACKIFCIVGRINVFTACTLKHFMNSFRSIYAHSASISVTAFTISDKQ